MVGKLASRVKKGKGSTFQFTLPLNQLAQSSQPATVELTASIHSDDTILVEGRERHNITPNAVW